MITNLDKLKSIFEPQLIQEIQQFGIFQTFKEGDLIMDYGKYVRMMPIVLQGTVKVSRLDEKDNEILLYYLYCVVILRRYIALCCIMLPVFDVS